MKNKIFMVALVAIVIAIVGSYIFPKNRTEVNNIVGSVAGPDSYFDYRANNDVRHYESRRALSTATTTVCAIKSPSSTSTLVHASVKVRVASTTATTWTFAKAATGFATTTPLNTFALSSGAQGTMVATSTFSTASPTIDDINVFAPNTYFVVGLAGIGRLTSDKLLGICQTDFLEI